VGRHKHEAKIKIFIEINKDAIDPYNHGGHRPPSLICLLESRIYSWHTSTLGMRNEIGKWQVASSTLGSYIYAKVKC
jgi:hypothetical protein